MAESNDGWFSSWLSAAKNKSSEVLEFVKKDLEEFGNAVKTEASSVVSTTGSVIEKTFKLDEPESTASTMKRSISSFLGQMNTVLNPSPDDSDTEAILITEGSETVTLNKLQTAIYELQKREKTFLEDPDLSLEKQYECWLEIIDDQLAEERLSKHLNSSTTLNNQYVKLVPENVTHQLFWKRYLFKKALLEDEMARQEAMERREIKEKQITEESLKWEQEDFAADIELTEEEQIKLLQQYEEETKQKNTQKQNLTKSPSKELIGEKVVFDKSSPTNPKKAKKVTKNKEIVKKNAKNVTDKNENSVKVQAESVVLERNEEHFKENDIKKKTSDVKVAKTDSSINLELEVKSSRSSSDGDWEKLSDVDK